MGLFVATGDLEEFGKLSGEDDVGNITPGTGTQGIADVIAHHDEGLFAEINPRPGQSTLRHHLARPPGREDDGTPATGTGDIKGGIESIGPGLMRNRLNDAGRAENGEAAEDAETGIEGALRPQERPHAGRQ